MGPAAGQIELRVLSGWSLYVDGAPVHVGRPQVRAVLTALALSDRPMPVDALVEFLWPDELPVDPRSSLNVVLTRARAVLADREGDLRFDGGHYTIDADVDAEQFVHTVTRAEFFHGRERARRLLGALAMWTGDPLTGLPDRPVFAFERERLGQVAERARRAAISLLLEEGRLEEVIDLAASVVATEPERDIESLALARAFAGVGRRRDAVRVLAAHRRSVLLAGLAVGAEVERLESWVLSRGVEVVESAAVLADDTPIVGRAAEIQSLAEVGDAGTRLVVGDPGIGKSTLIQAASDVWRTQGRPLLHVSAASSPNRLMAPIAEIAEAALELRLDPIDLAAPHECALGTILPGRFAASGQSPPSRDQLLDDVCAAVGELVPRGAVVAIDDCQWLDSLSLEVVRRLTRQRRVGLVLCSRSTHDLADLADLADETVELGALSVGDVGIWLEKELGDRLVDVEGLVNRTGGNPLFLRLLIDMLIDDLPIEDLPVSILSLVRQRLDACSQPARRVLEVAAIVGPSISLDLLEAIVGPTSAAIDEITSTGLASLVDSRFVVRHGLIGEAIVQLSGDGGRVAMLDQAATAAERLGLPAIEFWSHCVATAAIDPARAIRVVADATAAFADVYSWDEARTCLDEVDPVLRDAVGDDPDRLRILDARVRFAQGRSGGDDLLLDVIDQTRRAGRSRAELAAIIELSQAGCFALMGRDPEPIARLVERGLALADDETDHAWLQASSTRSLAYTRHHRAGRERFRSAFGAFDRIEDPRVRWTILRNADFGFAHPDDLDDAEHACDLMEDAMGHSPEIRALIAWNRHRHALMRGDADEVHAAMLRARVAAADAESGDAPLAYGRAVAQPMQQAALEAGCALMCGDLDAAERFGRRMIDVVDEALAGREIDVMRTWAKTMHGALLIGILRRRGTLADLHTAVERVESPIPSVTASAIAIRFAAGDRDGARDLLAPLADDGFSGLVPDSTWTGAVSLIAAPAAELVERPHLQRLYEQINPHSGLFDYFSGQTFGPIAGSAAVLADALGYTEDASDHRRRASTMRSAFTERLCELAQTSGLIDVAAS